MGLAQTRLSGGNRSLNIKGFRGAAGLAFIPKLTQTANVLLPKFTFELPIANRFPDDFAGRRIFASLDSRPQGGDLFHREGDADFLYLGHPMPPTPGAYYPTW
ncbi:hypothetical protein AZA_46946 [Nitrospirillum viridazoti Y2]|nr:hypothetical protein AZA_46946 [Nitrospirillum amazonense Y2]